MKAATHRDRQIEVDSLANQLMAKRQTFPALTEDLRPPCLVKGAEQVGGGPTQDRGEVGQRERIAQDGGRPKHLQRAVGQGGQLPKDTQPERARDYPDVRLGPAVDDAQRTVGLECHHQFLDEQRVPGRLRRGGQQARRRRCLRHPLHQRGHRDLVEGFQDEVQAAAVHQIRYHAVQDRGPGRRAERREQNNGEMRQSPSDVVHSQQRRMVCPVQILQGKQYRALQP